MLRSQWHKGVGTVIIPGKIVRKRGTMPRSRAFPRTALDAAHAIIM